MSNGSEIERFVFPDTGEAVRMLLIDGEPRFVATDVCTVLGYGGGARNAIGRLPDRMKGVEEINTPGGVQRMTVITEPGVYRLVMRSNLASAEAFQDWIAEEVVPAIRRTGSYSAVPAPAYVIPASYAEALELAARQARELEAVQTRVAELEPEAARAARTLDADGLALVGTVAKRFGLQERKLREFLYAEGLLIRNGLRRNEPLARYVQSGHFDVKITLVGEPVRERSTTYVTPKGEALIWKRLYDAGVVGSPRPPARQLDLLHTT
ncbi:phage antirepressor [Sphaerimonospora thailandensis]|uniref:Antirepressor n=1 Tax=Sphaerimonospora thailandensis TaxID=795644 RepID=A0A8J3R762_9ACTN|nr:phage antirepressor KilAC domain-containing protein [Sphaerimonospora thailandensis]GIH70357.1 antirepressor [Sphaerimonospora thailandensis]